MFRPGNKQSLNSVIGLLILLGAFAQAQELWVPSGSDIYNTNSGNVGIGTTTPNEKLVVMNQSVFGGNINALGGEPITVTGSLAGISFQARNGGTDRFVIYNTNGYLRFWEGGDRMALAQNTGYLGIGTSSPKNRLDVEGAAVIGASYSGTNTAPANGLLVQGNVGIGTSSPLKNLDVSGDILVNHSSDILGGGGLYLGDNYGYWNWRQATSAQGRDLFLDVYYDDSYSNVLAIDRATGRVSIGTTTFASGYLLAVDGKIIAEEFKVQDSGSWPDHVFQADYNLMPLADVERYIAQHQHLPDVPSAKEVAADGLSLGKTPALLLQKIEELTLYMIDLKKENEALKARMDMLAK